MNTAKIANKALRRLEKIPKSEWPAIWCELNKWNFPKKILRYNPLFFFPRNRHRMNLHMDINRPLMNKIESILGHKVLNREWNKDRMTDAEHEQWYNENYPK